MFECQLVIGLHHLHMELLLLSKKWIWVNQLQVDTKEYCGFGYEFGCFPRIFQKLKASQLLEALAYLPFKEYWV